MSSIINKVKEALHSDKDETPVTGYSTGGVSEGTAGPHSSRVANAADPRVDSDLDGSRRVGQTTTANNGYSTTGNNGHSTVGQSTMSGVPEGTAGPHSSRVANAADPRVDSDLDGSRRTGYGTGAATGVGSGMTGTSTGVGSSMTGTSGGVGSGMTGAPAGVSTGPVHSSSLANKLDPRVNTSNQPAYDSTATQGISTHQQPAYDSTTTQGISTHQQPAYDSTTTQGISTHHQPAYESTATQGTATHHHQHHHHHHQQHHQGLGAAGTTSGVSTSTNAGPHDSNIANKMDPRVDSDLDGRGQNQYMGGSHATPGSGTAQNTAGPHNSDLLNKLDPRVDSDLSGGKTVGGNMTHASNLSHKDPLDAAQVPPSVLRDHVGEPKILHDDKSHGYAERHGSTTQQETHI